MATKPARPLRTIIFLLVLVAGLLAATGVAQRLDPDTRASFVPGLALDLERRADGWLSAWARR